jgi:nucleoside-diphosphate-sugar epimerase
MARTAIVTGGVTGIGAATCKALKKAGYQVAAPILGTMPMPRDFAMKPRFRHTNGMSQTSMLANAA